MQLDIPGDLFHRLSIRTAPGSTEVDALREVLDAVEWLEFDQPNSEQLTTSLAQIDGSMNDIAEGRVLSVAEARQKSLDDLRRGAN
jgi:hypothetical protein